MNSESNKEDMDASKGQESISLVKPNLLALRLAYLVCVAENKAHFFRTTRKRMEKLATNKEITVQSSNQNNVTDQSKTPITEAYIDCCRYELEKLGFTMIRADKAYLVYVTQDLSKVRPIDSDNAEVYSLAERELSAKVADFFDSRKKKNSDVSKKKPITDDKQLVLQDIWVKLVEHAKANLNQSELPTLTYQELTSQLAYKVHRNGLASFLFSIEEYCTTNILPKLNYLVVKEGTGLPDGLKATDSKGIDEFKNEVKEILEFVQNNELPESPNIKYLHKARPKKSS